jgi:hypothetical protein
LFKPAETALVFGFVDGDVFRPVVVAVGFRRRRIVFGGRLGMDLVVSPLEFAAGTRIEFAGRGDTPCCLKQQNGLACILVHFSGDGTLVIAEIFQSGLRSGYRVARVEVAESEIGFDLFARHGQMPQYCLRRQCYLEQTFAVRGTGEILSIDGQGPAFVGDRLIEALENEAELRRNTFANEFVAAVGRPVLTPQPQGRNEYDVTGMQRVRVAPLRLQCGVVIPERLPFEPVRFRDAVDAIALLSDVLCVGSGRLFRHVDDRRCSTRTWFSTGGYSTPVLWQQLHYCGVAPASEVAHIASIASGAAVQ